MSYYRNVYLKSEDWKNLRLAVLHLQKNTCYLCGHKSPSNDVHHLQYRNLYDVKPEDLIVLCRMCHDYVHMTLSRMKEKHSMHRWRLIDRAYCKGKKLQIAKTLSTKLRKQPTPDLLEEGQRLMGIYLRKSLKQKRGKLNHFKTRLEAALQKGLKKHAEATATTP